MNLIIDTNMRKELIMRLLFATLVVMIAGCGGSEPLSAERHIDTDQLISVVSKNVASSAELSKVVDIDHSDDSFYIGYCSRY